MKCQRCGSETNGTREGDIEYCTSCGGVLGPAYTPEGDDEEGYEIDEIECPFCGELVEECSEAQGNKTVCLNTGLSIGPTGE